MPALETEKQTNFEWSPAAFNELLALVEHSRTPLEVGTAVGQHLKVGAQLPDADEPPHGRRLSHCPKGKGDGGCGKGKGDGYKCTTSCFPNGKAGNWLGMDEDSTRTVDGDVCRDWLPKEVAYYKDWKYYGSNNGMTVGTNFCREPSGEYKFPWCYSGGTTAWSGKWQYCDVCGNDHSCYSRLGEHYRGNVNVAANGKSCKQWSGKGYDDKIYDCQALYGNYCRNPGIALGFSGKGDGAKGPWCYNDGGDCDGKSPSTCSGNKRWSYCNVCACTYRHQGTSSPADFCLEVNDIETCAKYFYRKSGGWKHCQWDSSKSKCTPEIPGVNKPCTPENIHKSKCKCPANCPLHIPSGDQCRYQDLDENNCDRCLFTKAPPCICIHGPVHGSICMHIHMHMHVHVDMEHGQHGHGMHMHMHIHMHTCTCTCTCTCTY